MPLPSGTSIGPYQILAKLGEGGMGEVYRARDAKLGRDVALKIIPQAFAADPERLGRFQREAHLLASLNHPNIGHIYGFEDSGATNALVLELVEGPTLAERIAAGPIPLAEALRIARQIADALEAAHEAGIVHRDLKPGNVKVKDDGTVKVLDFGLAKALTPGSEDAGHHGATNSPTLTARATQLGVILGTAAYMAPEQAKGKPVDRRADVWAFGVLLYEMLTGRRLFAGDDVSETLAAVLTREPNWQQLPAETPPAIRRLLARCLTRDRRARLDSMSSARLDIDEAVSGQTGQSVTSGPISAPSITPMPGSLPWLPIAGVGLVSLVLGGLLVAWFASSQAVGPGAAPAAMTITSLAAPPAVASAFIRGFALSPDGQTLVVSARALDGVRGLWRRRLDNPLFERIAGTEHGMYPFWSSDGREVAFFAAGVLKRVAIGGGAPQTICKADGLIPLGSWAESGEILFSIARGAGAAVYQVPASGGTPKALVENGAFSPQWVRGGRSFLYIHVPEKGAQLWAASSDGSRAPARVIDLELPDPSFVMSPSGVVFFNRAGVLNAQRLDLQLLQPIGDAVGVGSAAGTPRAFFAASASADSLVVLAGDTSVTGGNSGDPVSRLRWVDRGGRTIGDLGGVGRYWTHRLSPDGQRVVMNPDRDLWAIDVKTAMRTRLTSGTGAYSGAIWSPDSREVLYREGSVMRLRPATGQGAAREMLAQGLAPQDWSADGRHILLSGRTAGSNSNDLFLLKVGDSAAKPFVASEYREGWARFSPNGQWVAYVSDVTGRPEVYVKPLEGDAAPVRVSSDGGEHPLWKVDRELFYLTPTDELVAVDLSRLEVSRTIGPRQTLFRIMLNEVIRDSYSPVDASPDGQRFLLNAPDPSEPLVFIHGYEALLKKAK